MEESALSLKHRSFKDERQNITQNIQKTTTIFFLMNNSPHTPFKIYL